jgi:putative transposase
VAPFWARLLAPFSALFTTTPTKAQFRCDSPNGRGRFLDNIFTERLWRTVKYEDVYPKDYGAVDAARAGLRGYFGLYNTDRLHQALGYRTPAEVHFGPLSPADFQAGRRSLPPRR